MAGIGTIGGVFLAPGVSKNNRLYTRQHVAAVVSKMQERLSDPNGRPITMLSHHAAEDDSTRICAHVTGVSLDESGKAHWDGVLVDTAAGRDIAAATSPDCNGRRALDGVSIRGWWNGAVKTVEHAGQTVTTADDLEVDGIDFTRSPGVEAARIITSSLAESAGAGRVLITEEAPPAEVTITEDTALDDPDSADTAPKKPYGDVTYADPGWQDDKKARYPLNSKAHVRAAWSFINKTANQKPYSADQVAQIKNKIKAAAKKYGINVAAETAQAALDSVAEAYLSISAMQGPADINISAYGVDNEDLTAAATKLGQAATAATKTLDPDQDDDLDLDNGDEVTCGDCGSSELPDDANFCPQCGKPLTTDDDSTESQRKEPGVTEQSKDEKPAAEQAADETANAASEESTESVDAPAGLSESDRKSIVDDVLAALDARKDTATESATEVDPGAATTESAAPPVDVAKLMEGFAGQLAEQVNKKIGEARDEMRDEVLSAYGTPPRKGLAEAAKNGPAKPLHEMSDEEQRAAANEMITAAFSSFNG